jgi:hypothetical protein
MKLTRWQAIRREFQKEATVAERLTFFIRLLIPKRWRRAESDEEVSEKEQQERDWWKANR